MHKLITDYRDWTSPDSIPTRSTYISKHTQKAFKVYRESIRSIQREHSKDTKNTPFEKWRHTSGDASGLGAKTSGILKWMTMPHEHKNDTTQLW